MIKKDAHCGLPRLDAPPVAAGRRRRGFTLIELIVSIAVMSLLFMIAAPSFLTLIQSNQLISATNEFLSGLQSARAEAIKQGRRVTMCKSANSSSCTTSGDWSQGWIQFVDLDHDAVADSGETVVRVGSQAPAGISIKGNTPVASYVSYGADSTSMMADGAFQAGTIRVCRTTTSFEDNARDLVLNLGRVVVRKATVTGTCGAP